MARPLDEVARQSVEPFETDFSDVQWASLLKRLTTCAAKWFLEENCLEAESVLPATGQSAKDLAFDTVAAFVRGEIVWEAKSTESVELGLYLLLKKVMRNDFLDLVKERRAYKMTDVLDPSNDGDQSSDEFKDLMTLASLPGDAEEEHYRLNAAIVARRILPLVDDDQHLVDYVNAVLVRGCLKREDIAACLQVNPEEITNRQRRLRTKLASWKRSVERAAAATQR